METTIPSVGETLKARFGLAAFRPGQREAVEAVLAGRDAVVVMPTGSGKSLCYQLAALLLDGTAIVVSPLIALMKDQVEALAEKGIAATCINSTVPKTEVERRLRAMAAGEYKLVYVAPERLRSAAFRERLTKTKVSLVAIDEAHCISQWGHDFRPDYLEVGGMLAAFPAARIMALTATATPSVREDIARQLRLGVAPRTEPFVEVLGFARPNLHIAVTPCRNAAAKMRRLAALVREHKTGIVYVATRKHAAEVYALLAEAFPEGSEITPLVYHGALTDAKRTAIQEEFMRVAHPVVVATNAFGMGIDRADIRFVAHWDIPGGVEAYYQEIGRAGRDGRPAVCELLFSYFDVKVQEYFITGANPDAETAANVWRMLRSLGPGEISIDPDAITKTLHLRNAIAASTVVNVLEQQGVLKRVRDGYYPLYVLEPSVDERRVREIFLARREKLWRDKRRLRAMVEFAYLTTCRHRCILDYFGDRSSSPCGGCDNCDAHGNRAVALPSEDSNVDMQPTVAMDFATLCATSAAARTSASSATAPAHDALADRAGLLSGQRHGGVWQPRWFRSVRGGLPSRFPIRGSS